MGADSLSGGDGNDTYYVDNAGDQVIETNANLATGGTDRVYSSVDLALSANVESLYLTGDAVSGTGNALANSIFGNNASNIIDGGAGADRLYGGYGSDTLIGGAGADRFVFNTAPDDLNNDTIADFSVIDDSIQLENGIFTSLGTGTGTLAASAFVIGDHAVTSTQYIVYDTISGALYYDVDGSGAGEQVQIADIGAGLDVDGLSSLDFQVI